MAVPTSKRHLGVGCLQPFRDERVRRGGSASQFARLSVFRRLEPRLGSLDSWELKNVNSIRCPRSFQDLSSAASRDVAPTVGRYSRRGQFSVPGKFIGVSDFYIQDDVGGHVCFRIRASRPVAYTAPSLQRQDFTPSTRCQCKRLSRCRHRIVQLTAFQPVGGA